MNGTFTRKIQCQSRNWIKVPPRIGPAASPAAPAVAQAPIALARSAGANSPEIRDRAGVSSIAAPIPITTRAPMSVPMLGESPARSEPMPKALSPLRNTNFRPKRSPSAPPRRSSPASAML